jgi:glycosyltransferase involved in cell wall biosynthesis
VLDSYRPEFRYMTISEWNRERLREMGLDAELIPPGIDLRYVESPDDEQVNELFCQATVFVQTSVHEGFALPPLEAMATGAAVVCTDAHGNRDFCVDGVNCLMPEANAGAVGAALARLLDDPELRARLGRAGIETAQEYAWERRIDALEAFFQRVAASRRMALAGELAPALASS